MGVLIYFIHHIATSIQLPQVIASIAGDLSPAIDVEGSDDNLGLEMGPSVSELLRRMSEGGGTVQAPASGYIQFISPGTLVGACRREGRRDSPVAPPGTLSRARPPNGDGMAAGRDRVGEPGTQARAHHGIESDPRPGPRLRCRSARGNRDQSPFTGSQRHPHGVDMHRLARREPLQGHDRVATHPRAPRQPWLCPAHHCSRHIRAPGRAGVSEDPSGRARNALSVDSPARDHDEDRRRREQRTAGAAAQAGGFDLRGKRAVSGAGSGPRRRPGRIRQGADRGRARGPRASNWRRPRRSGCPPGL